MLYSRFHLSRRSRTRSFSLRRSACRTRQTPGLLLPRLFFQSRPVEPRVFRRRGREARIFPVCQENLPRIASCKSHWHSGMRTASPLVVPRILLPYLQPLFQLQEVEGQKSSCPLPWTSGQWGFQPQLSFSLFLREVWSALLKRS